MDKDMEEMLRKMLGKPSNNNSQPSGNGSVDLNNENLIKDKLSSYFLQQMLESQSKQKQQEAAASSPGPSTSQPTAQNDNMKVDLSLPDVENLVKLLLQNVKVTNQDKSALEEEKAKRRALEMEAEEMRQKIKAFELQSQPTKAAAVQKKLDAFETINFFQSGKTGDSMNSTVAKYLEDLMLKDKLAKKKLFNDPKWFPGSSKDAEDSNTNSAKDKDLFKEMLRNPVSPGMGQHNFMQPGPSGPPFHGAPHPPPPFHGNVPPYQQNGFPMGHHGPYQGPWPGHGAGAPGMFQPPPHMMGYGAPGSMNWHGPPGHGYPGPMGPYPGPNQAGGPQQDGKKKQKQPQPQNQPKQKQQQQQQNQPKQKQQQPQQQNQPKQKQQNQQQQNQPKQKQVPNNLNSNQEVGKKKKNAQEQNKNGAQPKITVPVGSCVTLSPNSPPSQQNGTAENSSTSNGGINLTQEEINKLKQSIQLMNAAAAATGKTKKKNRKKKKGGEEGGNGEEDDSGSGGEAEKRFVHLGPVKNQLGGEGAKKKQNVEQQKKEGGGGGETQQAAAPGEGKKKKKKNAGGEASSDFSLYVGDRWPTLADIEAGRLKLDQPVKNILMVAKTPKGDICSTPKIIQDMLVFNKLHPTAALVFSSD